ncbi:MAG: aldehyde dehydrogenase family protein, partial [Fimbriimonadaceae bacterium]|nr:aldehyde dehydrogenase family protein [Alphaproteobacteria bacterium]
GYGLTLGIHSRIDARIADIISRVRVGNVYVNRNQVGAVVGSQPFGGEGLSGTGPKAGGPSYLTPFSTERVVSEDTTASGGNAALMTLGSGEFD